MSTPDTLGQASGGAPLAAVAVVVARDGRLPHGADEAVAEALGLNSRFRPVADIWAAGSGSQAPALATQVRLRERETPDLLGSRAQLPLYLKTDGSGYG